MSPGICDETVATCILAERAATIAPRAADKCRVHWTTTIAAVALLLALAMPALCGLVYTADDLGAFHLPLRAFYARATCRRRCI